MVLAALTGQQAQATVAANVAGPITGRQIQMQADPSLTGDGFVGTFLVVTKPGIQDDDGDQLAGWRYVWKVDGAPVAAEASVDAVTDIPAYVVKPGDENKAITICLKAQADKGFPASTQLSDEGCSSPITGRLVNVSLVNPGPQSVNENASFSLVMTVPPKTVSGMIRPLQVGIGRMVGRSVRKNTAVLVPSTSRVTFATIGR